MCRGGPGGHIYGNDMRKSLWPFSSRTNFAYPMAIRAIVHLHILPRKPSSFNEYVSRLIFSLLIAQENYGFCNENEMDGFLERGSTYLCNVQYVVTYEERGI